MRINLHIVKELHMWHLQSSRGATLGVFADEEVALVAARARAVDAQGSGLSARIYLHKVGEAAEVIDYPVAQ